MRNQNNTATGCRYDLSKVYGNRWLCTDLSCGLKAAWEDKKYNDTVVITAPPGMSSPEQLAKSAREMGDWLAQCHQGKVFQEDHSVQAGTELFRAHIGQLVKTLREDAGLNEYDFAARVGLSPSHIYRIEKGKYNLTIDTLGKICNSLGVEIRIATRVKD